MTGGKRGRLLCLLNVTTIVVVAIRRRRCATFTRRIPEVFVFALIIFAPRVVTIVGKVYVFLIGVVPQLNAGGVDWEISRIHPLAIRFGGDDDVSIAIFVSRRITRHVEGSGCQVNGGRVGHVTAGAFNRATSPERTTPLLLLDKLNGIQDGIFGHASYCVQHV